MADDLARELLTWLRSHYFGKYRGTVTDNRDPTERGRLKVRVPAVLDEEEVWAMPCVPYAGNGVGFYTLPEPGTGVWVEFEGGDPSYPICGGFFWGEGELPDDADPAIKVLKTEKLTLRIDDSADELIIESTSGAKITVSDKVKGESGGATQTVSSSGVVSEAGANKAEVTQASFNVNNGALEVV